MQHQVTKAEQLTESLTAEALKDGGWKLSFTSALTHFSLDVERKESVIDRPWMRKKAR